MAVLQGKVAVITGSTRGLGRAIARRYAEAGASVVLSSRSQDAVEQIAAEFEADGLVAAGMVCDVGDSARVQALADFTLEQFGSFDIWVNNAAISGPYGPTVQIPQAAFESVVQANILGLYYGSMVAMRHFLPKREGKLINILGGHSDSAAMQSAYGSSKAWVRTFTRSLAKEHADSGVGVYMLSPGMVDTDLLRKLEVVRGYEARLNPLKTVMRMIARPPEVPAEKALWLASPATDGKTGLIVKVSGSGRMLAGVMKEGLRRLLRQQGPPIELAITSIPPAFDPDN